MFRIVHTHTIYVGYCAEGKMQTELVHGVSIVCIHIQEVGLRRLLQRLSRLQCLRRILAKRLLSEYRSDVSSKELLKTVLKRGCVAVI